MSTMVKDEYVQELPMPLATQTIPNSDRIELRQSND